MKGRKRKREKEGGVFVCLWDCAQGVWGDKEGAEASACMMCACMPESVFLLHAHTYRAGYVVHHWQQGRVGVGCV